MSSKPKDTACVPEAQTGRRTGPSGIVRWIVVALVVFLLVLVVTALVVYYTVGVETKEGHQDTQSDVQSYTALLGDDVKLSCGLNNDGENPISWYFNEQELSITGRCTLSGKFLTITNVQASDGGDYTCVSRGTKSGQIKLAIIEVILANVTSHNGEGPHWEHSTQSLFFVDHFKHELHRWNSMTKVHEVKHFDGNTGFVVPYKDGGYIVSVERSLVHFNWETDEIKVLHEVEHGTFNVFNDGKVDPQGRVWTGTCGNFTDLEDPIYFYKGSMYMMDLDGSLHKKWENITISNGFSWTRDNTTMYYVDSIPRKVYKFEYAVDTGRIKYKGVAIDFVNEDEDFHVLGYPDGISMDREGMLWIACYDAAKVVRFNPNTGERLRIIDFNGIARRTTSCCFGGPNYDVLYVTSGGAQSQEESRQNVYSGSVFRITGLGVRGYPGRIYQGVV